MPSLCSPHTQNTFRMNRLLSPSLFLLANFLLATSAVAQVNGLGVSDSALFDTVINLPTQPDIGDTQSVGGVAGQTTQLNVAFDGFVGPNFDALAGTEVNIIGGSVGDRFETFTGSETNLISGSMGASSFVDIGGVVNIRGGVVGVSFLSELGSQVSISGGTINDSFRARGEVYVSGGSIGDDFGVLSDGEVYIHGGIKGDSFSVSSGGSVHLYGTSFLLDGVLLDTLTPGQPTLITDRDLALTGKLADGSMLAFGLNSNLLPGGADFFDVGATLTVTLVPEPTALVLLAFACVAAACSRFYAGGRPIA